MNADNDNDMPYVDDLRLDSFDVACMAGIVIIVLGMGALAYALKLGLV